MHLYPQCFYSNRVEILFDRFKKQLFANTHPLTRRLVIVPSPTMRSWLLHSLVKDRDIGVAAGIELAFIEPSLDKLIKVFSSSDHCIGSTPSLLEISLAI